jgi:hypothetical protein
MSAPATPQRMERSQVLFRQFDRVPCAIAPIVARQTAAEMLASVINLNKRLFAVAAGHIPTLTQHSLHAPSITAPQPNTLASSAW